MCNGGKAGWDNVRQACLVASKVGQLVACKGGTQGRQAQPPNKGKEAAGGGGVKGEGRWGSR